MCHGYSVLIYNLFNFVIRRMGRVIIIIGIIVAIALKIISYHRFVKLQNRYLEHTPPIMGMEILSSAKLNNNISDICKANKCSPQTRNIEYVWSRSQLESEGYWNFRNFLGSEIDKLSVLGRRLFLHEEIGQKSSKVFLIYIYKYGKRIERRLINHYSKERKNPFEQCSVSNCKLSYNYSDFHNADAVLFHLHLLNEPLWELKRENYNQRWIWLSDESLFNTFLRAKDKNLDHYNGLFNWSMTYRAASDIPVPYGRTVPLLGDSQPQNEDFDIFSKKRLDIAILGSNCGGRNRRWKYVSALQKYIEIDTYGGCGKLKCPGHFTKDCPVLSEYKFYLAFENSNCKEYITEKAWWNAFAKEAVPVVMGCLREDYERHFPPNSFIHVEDFKSAEDLAKYLRFLLGDKDAYNEYHVWRRHFSVLNEHGYFATDIFHYCRLCEALNYNTRVHKTYSSLASFWNLSRDCNTRTYV